MKVGFEKRYEKRLRQSARLERKTRACLRHQCGNKIQHENFLTAMIHAIQLTKKMNKLYFPYYCEKCGFGHVGHDEGSASLVWMMEGISVKIKYVNGVIQGC